MRVRTDPQAIHQNAKKEWTTLSINPIDLPGRSTPVLTLAKAPLPDVEKARELSFREQCEARRNNELDYEVTVNILGLPPAAHEIDADAVRVTSSDIGVLAAWLEEKGGTVTRQDVGHGVTLWKLHTHAGVDEGNVGCWVLVTVPVPESGWVPWEVSSKAVAA